MTRINVQKFLFIGTEQQKEKFFSDAQKLGVIHFINISNSAEMSPPLEVQDLVNAIKVLRTLPVMEQLETKRIDLGLTVSKEVLALKHLIESKEERLRILRLEIERIREYGNFSIQDIRWIEREGKRSIQFFFTKAGTFKDGELPETLIFIASDKGLDFYLSIAPKRMSYEKFTEMHFERSLSELFAERKILEGELVELEKKLGGFQKYSKLLHQALVLAHNRSSLAVAKRFTKEVVSNRIFTAEGWVPVDLVQALESFCEREGIFAEEVEVEKSDKIPTCLQNEGAARVGEDLVHIYDTPSDTDKDPSLWVLLAFIFFFAIIISDAGYGLVLAALSLYLYLKFPKLKGIGRRLLYLLAALSFSTIFWGVITTQAFGMEISVNSPLRKVSLLQWVVDKKADYHLRYQDDVFNEWKAKYPAIGEAKSGREVMQLAETNGKNPLYAKVASEVLLEFSLVVGMVHISLSFLRYIRRHWSGFGWILFMIGAYLYVPSFLGTVAMPHYLLGLEPGAGAKEGLQLVYGGGTLAVLLAVIQNRLSGIGEIMNLIQVFADVMSYLRLYALGLAGGIMSATINDLAGGMPVVLGILVLFLGHSLNLGLNIMSGVIHGLRLNFLEWYHYSFEGGGYPYNPLKLYEVD